MQRFLARFLGQLTHRTVDFARGLFAVLELWCINRFDPSDELRADFGEACVVAAENLRYLIKSYFYKKTSIRRPLFDECVFH
jgi:hypothetical protein